MSFINATKLVDRLTTKPLVIASGVVLFLENVFLVSPVFDFFGSLLFLIIFVNIWIFVTPFVLLVLCLFAMKKLGMGLREVKYFTVGFFLFILIFFVGLFFDLEITLFILNPFIYLSHKILWLYQWEMNQGGLVGLFPFPIFFIEMIGSVFFGIVSVVFVKIIKNSNAK